VDSDFNQKTAKVLKLLFHGTKSHLSGVIPAIAKTRQTQEGGSHRMHAQVPHHPQRDDAG